MNSNLFNQYFQETQQKWDALFNRHRLTLVTHSNEQVLHFFEDLKLVSGKQKDDRHELFLQNKRGTCHLVCDLVAEEFWVLEIRNKEKEMVNYSDFGVRLCPGEWVLSPGQQTEMVPFFQDIRRFVRTVSKDMQLCCEYTPTKNEC